jgi:hypothetical protein
MKTIRNFSSLLLSGLVMVIVGTGCLKDKYFDEGKAGTDIDKSNKILEIMGPIVGSYGQILDFSLSDTTVNMVTLNLAADQPSSEDIKVTLAVDPAVITEYNARTGENFDPLPASKFSFSTLEVTIPKGEREAVLQGTILDPSFLETGKFALGVKIVSSSSPSVKVSGNYGKQVVALRVKNKYHGLYHATGVFTHPTAGPRPIDEDKELATVEPNSVLANLGDLGGAGYQMVLAVQPDNTVTITKSGATPSIQYLGPNFYDPVNKAFNLHYSYTPAGGAPRIVQEVIKRK